MSHIACPICGKYSAISGFDPSKIDLDIKVVQFRNAGKGRGFVIGDEYSALDDISLARPIAIKNLDLTKFFRDENLLSDSEIEQKLGLRNTERDIENLRLKNENSYLNSRISSMNEANEEREKLEEREKKTIYILEPGLKLENEIKCEIDERHIYFRIDKTNKMFLAYLYAVIPWLSNDLRSDIRGKIRSKDDYTKKKLDEIWKEERGQTFQRYLNNFMETMGVPESTTSIENIEEIINNAINAIKQIYQKAGKKSLLERYYIMNLLSQ